uniref:Gag-Pol polyprotein n=1 Tax=Tanacetum cinerariifolium TaxID=118510 RepID=A0A6L2KFJ0_TANCI|nr:hypothetical protein [Tanacetum cinerariifolium]
MLNKENYVPWSSPLLRYAKSRPNGKLIHNSIINGPYVRRMIHEPEDIYVDVDCFETAQEIWLRVQQLMKGSDIGIQEKNAKLFNEWERFTSNDGESIESYYHRFLKLMNDLKRNKHFPKKIARNANQNGNGNLVAARAEGNATGHNGPLLEFHRTLMMGIRLCFNRLTSRSMISTGSSTKQSLSSMCISSKGTANSSSDKHFFRLDT